MKKSVSPDKKKSKTLLKQYGARLLPQHAKLLAASAINPKVARQRGYRSVTAKAPLRKLGFGQAQCRVPALLVPIRDVHGKLAAHQIRPDEPRKNRDGKPIKYESPTGSRPVLDVPRRVRRWLGDPQRPLFITEGARKADAAASRKLACLSVAGVFGWRGKNTFDGKTVLADWESIALQGRRIYLTFDSDVIEKRPVYDALVRLRGFLASKGADVLVIYLPPGEGGAKCGLDDYFAAGHSVRDLLHLAAAELRRPPSTDLAQYFIDNRRICRRGRANGDLVAEPLCNFTAKIVEERILDDGQDPVRRLVLKGRLCTGTRLPRTEVDAAEFPGLTWVPIRWGTSAIINAGANCRDHLRAAIQELSSPTVKHIFVHTGLRKIGKQRVFLHGRGAIGIRGIAPDLPPELQRYYLPHPPADPAKHVRRSLGLLTLAPLDVTVPLLAAMYRAPTASLLPPDFTLWLEGPSSSLKSTLSALFLSHFGDFDHEHLPANWESTANSLERRAFVLKDLPLIIDDYAPGGGNHREIEGKASRILRSVGNRSARGRLAVNLKERRTFLPRCLLISTGEQRPPGQSILARMVLVAVERRGVDLPRLTEAQENVHHLQLAMAGFVAWLLPQIRCIRKRLRKRFTTLRAEVLQSAGHLRIPASVAHLLLGIELLLKFATYVRAATPTEAKRLKTQCRDALLRVARRQAKLVANEDPARRFLQVLATLITQGKAQLLDKDGGGPSRRSRPSDFVGWVTETHLLLNATASHKAVSQFCHDSGEPFAVRKEALHRALKDQQLLTPDKSRRTATVRIGNHTHRVLRLSRDGVEKLLRVEFPTGPATERHVGPDLWDP